MRLTLRTLLAYLDDILDPSDKEELAEKIESSEFAQDLVHRTRDTMRRLRLSAPQVVGVGMGLDPNSVAEYLDNVLPPEQVGDYERICLESDVHLAEAAACHHVLTMVLGEPADVDPRARQRMYMIPTEARDQKRLRAEPAHIPVTITTVAAATMPAPTPSPSATVSQTSTFEVPEYLRTRAWWQSRVALATLGLVLLAATTLYLVSGMMGWFDESTPVAALTEETTTSIADAPAPGESQDEAATPAADVATTPDTTSPSPTDLTASETAPESNTAPVADPYAPQTETEPAALPPPPQPLPPGSISAPAVMPDPNETEVATDPSTTPPIGSEPPAFPPQTPTDVPAPNDGNQANVVPLEPIEIRPNDDTATDVTAPAGTAPPVEGPAILPPPPLAANNAAGDTARLAAVPSGAAMDTPVAEEQPTGPLELGTYLGGKTVLLRYDNENGAWFRVQPRNAVTVGERLLALPEFRPKITLASGIHLDMSGGTQVAMNTCAEMKAEGLPAVDANSPAIELLYGRIILINTSNSEQQVRVKLGPSVGDARLGRNATLAIEVERQHVRGTDPQQSPAPVFARLFAPEGDVEWHDGSNQIAVDKASRWTIANGTNSEVEDDPAPPEWIDQEPVIHLSEQRFGAPAVESTLVSDRPVDIQLLELFKGRDRKEVKSLVARSSIYVGLFAPFIDALRDSQQKWPTWKTHIETLRSAMAHGPDSAALVQQALIEQRGRVAGGDLYEMLCGYTADQIGRTPDEMKVGALATLIDRLENDSLDYRVLAVYDLWEITGKQLMPNPAANLTVRTQNVRRWRDRLNSGELKQLERP